MEKQINSDTSCPSDSNAWAHIVPAGNIKPATNAGAFVLQSYTELNTKVNILETEIKKEKQKREESDLILANQISQINNLLKEKDIITRDNERIDHAHTTRTHCVRVLYHCQVCFERQHNMRLVPCGHMATCEECTEQIMNINGKCPLCRTAVTKTEHTFVS